MGIVHAYQRRGKFALSIAFLLALIYLLRLSTRHEISRIPTIVVRTDAEERQYHRLRGRYGWVGNFLLGATLALTVIAAMFSAWSALETTRQADAADEANRPWLKPDDAEVHQLDAWFYNQNKTIMSKDIPVLVSSLNVNIKNIGHSPARDVFVRTYIIPIIDFGPIYNNTGVIGYSQISLPPSDAEICKYDTRGVPFRTTIFPDEVKSLSSVSQHLMRTERVAYDRAGHRDDLWKKYLSHIRIQVRGCVLYKDNIGRVRHSQFGYELGTVNLFSNIIDFSDPKHPVTLKAFRWDEYFNYID